MKILFVGDVIGSHGRRAVGRLLPALRSEFEADFVAVNGENAAGGFGITPPTFNELISYGADVVTLGNHAFAKRESFKSFENEARVLRPANYPPGVPGVGFGIFTAKNGERVAVANLLGRAYMDAVDCPFRAADTFIEQVAREARTIIVDFHAEATSEKIAFGWHLDGRVSAVIGTHTHVQTSDERALPGGTAYISDAGMTGVRDSVIGMDKGLVIERFMTQVGGKFKLADGEAFLQGVFIETDDSSGCATSIVRISRSELL